jgi:hypothetical protein
MTSIETPNKPKRSLCLPKLPTMIRPLASVDLKDDRIDDIEDVRSYIGG